MEKSDYLIFAVWIVILTGIGFATYYGVKYMDNGSTIKAIQMEKQTLSKDKIIDKNNSSNKKTIIDGIIMKKNTTITNNKATIIKEKKSDFTTNTNTTNKNTSDSNTKTNTYTNSNKNTTKNQNTNTSPSNIEENNTPTIQPRTLISEGKEEEREVTSKYGTIIAKVEVYSVKEYSDNTKYKNLESIRYDINRDGYNATATDLIEEAEKVINNNYGNYERLSSLINGYRSQVGSTPLVLDRDLCLVATVRAIERAYGLNQYIITHNRPDGRDFVTVFEDLDIPKGTAWSENITTRQVSELINPFDIYTVEEAAEDWYNSAGHKANLEDSKFNKTGIGVYQLGDIKYWVQVFQKN